MQSLACLNGVILPADEAMVPITDRGFVFADSVYEVCRVYQGRCWLENDHLNRLQRSLAAVRLPAFDGAGLTGRIRETLAASGAEEATVYIQITRGVAPRSHPFPVPAVPPTELILVRPYDDAATAAERDAGVACISRPDLRWGRCDVKSTNLLPNVLALQEAREAGGFEAILVDRNGLVTEATHSSLMWVRNGQIFGTPNGTAILPGTTRDYIQRLALEVHVTYTSERVTIPELQTCPEVFLTGTTIEVMPVVSIDGRKVGTGSPGPITRLFQAAFLGRVQAWLNAEGARVHG
jgi:D-alanine transaminase